VEPFERLYGAWHAHAWIERAWAEVTPDAKLSFAGAIALVFHRDHPAERPRDLVQHCDLERANVNWVYRKLTEAGWLRRDRPGGKAAIVRLTVKGESMAMAARERLEQLDRFYWESLPEASRDGLDLGLTRLKNRSPAR
jgi:DNA-binding MarR family transcriptional regulator